MESKPAHRKALSLSPNKGISEIQPLLREITEFFRKTSPKGASLSINREQTSIDRMINDAKAKAKAHTSIIELSQVREKISDSLLRRKFSSVSKNTQIVNQQKPTKGKNTFLATQKRKKQRKRTHHYGLIMEKAKEAEAGKLHTPPPLYKKFVKYMKDYTDCMDKSKNLAEANKMIRHRMWDNKANRHYERESVQLLKEMEVLKVKIRRNSII